ncbi:alginate O-acetyltransferase AlgX-related protein [Burkholderia sp. MSMB0856]|uniref:alginate O-acetyltransferase AlgX-related protein n=1 Tax=Burkholderia sp. MSMB0856 TaxID=1637869 RepID=UPI0009E8E890|nr:hypothetical protein [Burkholderia sp. MSMB0856]
MKRTPFIAKAVTMAFGIALCMPIAILAAKGVANVNPAAYDLPLKGMQQAEKIEPLTLRTWISGDFEDFASRHFSDRLPLRGWMISASNEILFRVFRKSYMGDGSIVIGKQGMLFEKTYTAAYCSTRHTDAEIDGWARDIKALQERVAIEGRTFVYLITPSKVSYFPEMLPDGYPCDLRNSRSDYRRLVGDLAEHGVNFVDTSAAMIASKGNYNVDMFSNGGTHWNLLGAAIGTNLLLNKIRAVGGPDYSTLSYSWKVENAPNGTDTDLFDLLNRGLVAPNYAVPHLDVRAKSSTTSQSKQIVFVGGSFVGQVIELLYGTQAAKDIDYFYYFKLNHQVAQAGHPIVDKAVNVNDRDTYKTIFTSPVIVFEENEANLISNHGKLLMEKFGVI